MASGFYANDSISPSEVIDDINNIVEA